MAENVKWHGFRELEENMKLLGAKVHEEGVLLMMSKAAEPMRDEAKRRVPVLAEATAKRKPGTVRDRIRIWRYKKSPYAVTYFVGVLRLSKAAVRKFVQANIGKIKNVTGGDNPNDPFYWKFLEFGTSKMGARPFLRPAFESQKYQSVRVALDVGRQFITKVATQFKRTPKP